MPEGTNSISLTAGPRHVLRRYRCADKCIGRYQRGWSGALSAATPQQLDRPSTTLQRAKRVEEICGGLTREVHVHRPQHCKPMVCLSPDHASGEFRSLAGFGARVSIGQRVRGNPNLGRQDKSAAVGRAHVVGWIDLFAVTSNRPAGGSDGNVKAFNKLGAIAVATHQEADPSPRSSTRRKRLSRGCAGGRPAGPLLEVLRTRLARCRTDAIDPKRKLAGKLFAALLNSAGAGRRFGDLA
jgi:hypothetical protein